MIEATVITDTGQELVQLATFRDLQRAVGGYVEVHPVVYNGERYLAAVNEDGRFGHGQNPASFRTPRGFNVSFFGPVVLLPPNFNLDSLG